MIDPKFEELITLSAACRLLPARRRGKKPHLSTLYRWAGEGCRGIVLETLQVGGTKCTSREALARFCHRLTRQCVSPALTVSTEAVAAAGSELDVLGM
jgi:hypothetical protein